MYIIQPPGKYGLPEHKMITLINSVHNDSILVEGRNSDEILSMLCVWCIQFQQHSERVHTHIIYFESKYSL